MSYEKLSIKGFINEVKDVSSGPHPRKFCFVLGAGASISSGIKSGQELVKIWDRELQERNAEEHLKWKEDLKITEDNKYSFYSRFYERRFRRQPADGYNYLEKLMEHAKPSVGYVMLSYLLTKTKHNIVITTNFDHLTEDAVNYYAQTIPLVIGHESLAHYVNKQINRPTVIKIHRDLLFDPKNRTDELEILHENWKKALGEVFSDYHPIFIGYAGNDNSLMNFLLENSDKFMSNEWSFPYWMLYNKDKADKKVMDFLINAGGYLVEHNGFDEILSRLGAAFSYKLQTREEFLGDAEKRYLELSIAIDKFTETSVKQTGEADGEGEGAAIEQAIEEITSQTVQQRLYREAVSLYNSGKYKEALAIEKKLVELNQINPFYHHNAGDTLHEMKRYEEAEEEKRKATKLEPTNAEYHDSLSVTLHTMGKYEEAEKETRKAIELDPTNAEYHESLGITLHMMEKYEEEEKAIRKAIQLEPTNARYHNRLGINLQEMERYEEAEKERKKATELDPMNAEYHDGLSVTLHRMEKYEEAEKETRKAIELEPTNAKYHDSLGITLHEMGRYEEAEKEKRKAIKLEPTNAGYHNSLGITLQRIGRYKDAEEETRKATELDAENKEYSYNLDEIVKAIKKQRENK